MGSSFESSITRATGNNFADLYVRSMLDKSVEVKENKNKFLLEKYFKNTDELNTWKKHLKKKNIDYTYKKQVNRGQIAVIKIWHDDESVIEIIAKKLGIE